MSVLKTLFGEGAGSGLVEDFLEFGEAGVWTPAEQAVIRKLPAVGEHWFNTTEDRREK